ncbi:alpha/beta hydrolase [Candidatus Peregrinibacteria bacterium]|nr:MAG: alpha/beta hydrolase [Candidatus Peregrinibacteria bacterium]
MRNNCAHFEICQSDNDPYVSIEKAEELSHHLNTPVTLVPNAGHFNQSAAYTRFDLLLESIERLT